MSALVRFIESIFESRKLKKCIKLKSVRRRLDRAMLAIAEQVKIKGRMEFIEENDDKKKT